ncbi:DegT/DnrJ/EryC1/StrS family aminotransferase [Alteribacter aurantiacus]|uniref:DegT/DnrJ/EryC1/StrS family aminotransferase n=1 Tax=Alteribacter aurantiacus TaxID=254410 RepID=UPI000420C0F3|nr:DegT/DnrJ/EryC1/StrS family aminotransferase [Alteribacter aurantiacus]
MKELAINGGNPVFTKPFPTWPIYGEEEEKAVIDVVRSGKWGGTNRRLLPELEMKFSQMHEADFAIPVTNGTLGITVALQASGVEPGDEVIMPPYTFIATASSALLFGAIPVFADVEEDTLLMDPDKVEAAITEKTKAIVTVHLAGASSDLTRLKQIANNYGLPLIEDAAQAIGTEWKNKKVGAIGDFGTFSFQSGKNVTSGEGGMILTNDEELADTAWSITNVGRIRKGKWYQHERVGWNLRMTEFQAAILLAQLGRYKGQLEKRQNNARLLDQSINEIEGIKSIESYKETSAHSYHLYMFRITDAKERGIDKTEFSKRLTGEGIPVQNGYVSLNQNMAIVNEIEKRTGRKYLNHCPISEKAANEEVLWLPQNVLLAEEEDMTKIKFAIDKVIHSFQR